MGSSHFTSRSWPKKEPAPGSAKTSGPLPILLLLSWAPFSGEGVTPYMMSPDLREEEASPRAPGSPNTMGEFSSLAGERFQGRGQGSGGEEKDRWHHSFQNVRGTLENPFAPVPGLLKSLTVTEESESYVDPFRGCPVFPSLTIKFVFRDTQDNPTQNFATQKPGPSSAAIKVTMLSRQYSSFIGTALMGSMVALAVLSIQSAPRRERLLMISSSC